MSRQVIALASFAALLGLAACGRGKSSNANSTNAAATAGAMGAALRQAMPNCGATQPVWVNTRTKVYHEPGDPRYGKTTRGTYMCPSEAVAKGYHAAEGGTAHHRHRRRSERMM